MLYKCIFLYFLFVVKGVMAMFVNRCVVATKQKIPTGVCRSGLVLFVHSVAQ